VCHMPMARFESRLTGREGEVFAHLPFNSEKTADRLAADGVSCSVCHQIAEEKLGTRESFTGGFVIDTKRAAGERQVFGPFAIDAGRTRVMQSSSGFRPTEAEYIQQSEVCATCHTLYTKARGPNGEIIGELPEQVPYLEWLHSEYRGNRSCQSCHMPAIEEETAMSSVLGEPRQGVSQHVFLGGNFFIQRMLNRFRGEIGVTALPEELDTAAGRTVAHLQSESARLSIDRMEVRAGRLETEVSVVNLGGHKLPTAYPSRRAWIHVVVRDRSGRVVFESGAIDGRGAIQGNDNDADPARFESHHTTLSAADQVQIYESILSDPRGSPTTGLLSAVRYLKDNRLLPRGFDKQTANKDIAVIGGAAEDGDFSGGGDRVRYSVAVDAAQGPFQVEAELWFQPVSYRWAENLRRYDAEETRRFTRYYDAMASASAIPLARARSSVRD
ncbi:MAG: hypothetical protein ACRD44_01960, partial [Bryobacteraceae bacterium]